VPRYLRFCWLSVLLAVAGVLVHAPASHAAPKRPAPACGLDFLPLVDGVQWTYELVAPMPLMPGYPPPPPSRVVIKVVSVQKNGSATEIKLEETYRDVTTAMVATCSAAGLTVPAESFFFAGEPGGALLMEMTGIQHEGASFPPGKQLVAATQTYEKLKAGVTRQPSPGLSPQHADGTVELERLLTVGGRESVETGMGPYRATVVTIKLQGRGKVGEREQEIPLAEGAFWFAPKIGIVRVREISGREWQLVDTNALAR
jgi:hypothetical protein